jgi:predicted DNA-binding transcriptional regulator YafY
MKTIEDSGEQTRRILKILSIFHRLVECDRKEIQEILSEEFPSVSDRTMQRDLKLLEEENYIEKIGSGPATKWRFIKPTFDADKTPPTIKTDELLSFYMLKGYLNAFQGTQIEKEINSLANKLEILAPGSPYFEEVFYWDQNFGKYDYTKKYTAINQLIKNICDKSWIKIAYSRNSEAPAKEYLIFPEGLYYYSGSIYLAAYYADMKKVYNFVVQNIISITAVEDCPFIAPPFDLKSFSEGKFGVFDGDLVSITLLIKKEAVKFFENRKWHATQKFTSTDSGAVKLRFKAPITPDLLSWICRWSDCLTVEEPISLKIKVRNFLQESLKNFE